MGFRLLGERCGADPGLEPVGGGVKTGPEATPGVALGLEPNTAREPPLQPALRLA